MMYAVPASHSAIAPTARTASAAVLPVINPITAAISARWLKAVANRDLVPIDEAYRNQTPMPKPSTTAVVPRALSHGHGLVPLRNTAHVVMIRPVKMVATAFFHILAGRQRGRRPRPRPGSAVVVSFIVVLLSVRTLADVDLPLAQAVAGR